MTTAERWIAHYTRLLDGWLSERERRIAEIERAYWRQEAQFACAASLGRLRRVCEERGADYEKTVARLKKGA